MKLNDPFGRMARRREREYESLCKTLQQAGMTDRAKAEELMDNLRKRSKTGLWVIVPLTLVLALIFREYAVFVLAFGALATLWLVNTMRRGQEYIARYIEEFCDNADRSGETRSGEAPDEGQTTPPPHSDSD